MRKGGSGVVAFPFRSIAVAGVLLFLAAVVVGSLGAPARAEPELNLWQLNGGWQGDGHQIIIDVERSQARRDPAKPFQWEAFQIKNISGNVAVFRIGPFQYIAFVEGDRMDLTSHSFKGAASLRRVD